MLIKTEGNIVDLYIMGNLCSSKCHSYSVSAGGGELHSQHAAGSYWAGRGDSSEEKQTVMTRESPSSTGLGKEAVTAPGGFPTDPVGSSFMVWDLAGPMPGPGGDDICSP